MTPDENRARLRKALEDKGFQRPPPPEQGGMQRLPEGPRTWRQMSPTRWVNAPPEDPGLAFPLEGFAPQNLGRIAQEGIERVGGALSTAASHVGNAVGEHMQNQRYIAGRRREVGALRDEYEATRGRMDDAEGRLERDEISAWRQTSPTRWERQTGRMGQMFNDMEQRFSDDLGGFAQPPIHERPVEDLSDEELMAEYARMTGASR